MARARLNWALGAGLVAFVVYLPALRTGFSADDFFILSRLQDLGGLRHPLLYFQSAFFGYYRPLAFVSHAIDWHLWGSSAAGFHLTSVCLHAANTMLVYVLGRRLCDRTCAAIGALLFATHPAAHEAVYWMAARFDLLATFLILVSLILRLNDRRLARWMGVAAFGLALLAKESALALPVLALAYDVIVRRRGWRESTRRLLPLLGVVAGYALVRGQAADLAAAGVRLPKLLVWLGALAALLLLSYLAPRWRRLDARRLAWMPIGIGALGVALAALVLWPPTSAWAREKLGFVAYAAYYLASPVVLPPLSLRFFTPATAGDSLPGLAAALAIAAVAWRTRQWLAAHAAAAYCAVFTAAALIPVLSLTGSPRYVYLSTAGAALLVGFVFEILSGRLRALAAALLAAVVVVSLTQLVAAASAWRWGSEMVRDGLALMTAELEPCGTRDVVLLTAPKGIRGVYPNFYWDAFKAMSGCTPASFSAVLHVVRLDARVEISRPSAGVLELRVPHYAGNMVASRDLRSFDRPVRIGTRTTFETAAGRLETWPEGETQVFRLHPTATVGAARLFYYSEGRLRSLAGPQAAGLTETRAGTTVITSPLGPGVIIQESAFEPSLRPGR